MESPFVGGGGDGIAAAAALDLPGGWGTIYRAVSEFQVAALYALVHAGTLAPALNPDSCAIQYEPAGCTAVARTVARTGHGAGAQEELASGCSDFCDGTAARESDFYMLEAEDCAFPEEEDFEAVD
mmetsp:Transcript_99784/g.213684  ORF Transcript_99784/g.213684 Transcript_99784/m.213684 type:complete len:126 (+) Transcript_99784:58-435(+)